MSSNDRPVIIAHHDEASFQARLAAHGGRPWLTPALVAINFAIFAIMVASGVSALRPSALEVLPWGADYGPLTFGGEPWRVISNAFLHFGILHVALNMFALWQMGRLVERLFHPLGFAALYVAAAVGGSLASLFMHPVIVSAGASGAVFGVYGAFLAYLLRQQGAIPASVLSRLRGSTLAFIGYNLIFGFIAKGVDNSAHIGGLVTGFACGWLLATPLGQPIRKRAALLVMGATVALATAALALHSTPPDYLAAIDHFSTVETRSIKLYNDIITRAKAEQASDADFAEVLETQVLPPWKEALDRLQRLEGLPDSEEQMITKLRRYAQARFGGWTKLAKARRSGDTAAGKAAAAELQHADALLIEFNRDAK
jgi:rhomboid protease GluP